MKKLLLISIFAISINLSKAQSWVYHPFANDSLVWLISHQDSFGDSQYWVTEMLGDTTIGANTYKKLYTSSPMTSPIYTTPLTFYYSGALRQDIAAKKVYTLDYWGAEKLLYDFNLVVGDTFKILTVPVVDTIYVASIDSVLVGGNYFKRYNMVNTAGIATGFFPSPLIQSIGNGSGLQEFYDLQFEGATNLLCFSHGNTHLYPELYPPIPGFPPQPMCSISLGISDLKDNVFKIELMPNPTADQVNLKVSCHDGFEVEVQELSGKLLERRENQLLAESSIDLSAYPAGIYLIRLINKTTGDAVSKKVVKR